MPVGSGTELSDERPRAVAQAPAPGLGASQLEGPSSSAPRGSSGPTRRCLQTLFADEVAHRRGTRLTRAIGAAGFPFLCTIEEFDFSYQSTLRLTSIGSLLAGDFVTEGGAVILEGKPGRGKTHLAVAIAYRALQNGFDALFTTCADLIDDLSAASRDGKLR